MPPARPAGGHRAGLASVVDEARAVQEGLRERVGALGRRVGGKVLSPTGLLALLSSAAVVPVAVASDGPVDARTDLLGQ